MTRAIYFDMDGTIANLYGVEDWLNCIIKGYTKPYREAKSLINMRELSKELNRLQKKGYVIGIISWLAKGATNEYNKRVTKAKMDWLKRHLGSVQFDNVHIIEYGTPKEECGEGILFDDEKHNRIEWNKVNNNMAFDETNILTILKGLK